MFLQCRKCNESEIYLQYRGMQIGAYCSNCGSWIKWIGKKELPAYQRKGFKVYGEGHQITLKQDKPLGIIVEPTQNSNEEAPFEVEDSVSNVVSRGNTGLGTDLDLEVEIEKRVRARLIVEKMTMEEEIENRVKERMTSTSINNRNKDLTVDPNNHCCVCEGEPLNPEQGSQIDITIYGGVMTVTNLDGTNILGFYKIKYCPECGKAY